MQLSMILHLRLQKDSRLSWIEPGSHVIDRHLDRGIRNPSGVLDHRSQGVPVHYAAEHVVLILQLHPIAQRAFKVAEVQFAAAGRLHAAKESFLGHGSESYRVTSCAMLAALLMAVTVSTADPFHNAAWLTIPVEPSAIESARWIWAKTGDQVPTAENAPAGTIVLLRDFDYAGENRVRLTFSCDNRCIVQLNNVEVGRSDDWRSPKTVMLQPQPGRNTLRISATNDAANGAKNPGGFIAALEIGDQVVITDSSWRS